jgi:hypothetical protein
MGLYQFTATGIQTDGTQKGKPRHCATRGEATHREMVHRLDDQGEAGRPIMPIAGEQADAGWITASHQAVAIVLDLVNPPRAGRRSLCGGWKARRDEPGRKGTLRHAD